MRAAAFEVLVMAARMIDAVCVSHIAVAEVAELVGADRWLC